MEQVQGLLAQIVAIVSGFRESNPTRFTLIVATAAVTAAIAAAFYVIDPGLR